MVSLPMIALGIAYLGYRDKSASGCPQICCKCHSTVEILQKQVRGHWGNKNWQQGNSREVLERNWEVYSKKSPRQDAQLNCLYTSACILGNKQDELEATVLLGRHYVAAVTETWWDDSHDWSEAIDGYKMFRRDRQERRGGGVALYIKKWIVYEQVSLKNGRKQVENGWVRDWGNEESLIDSVYCSIKWSLLMRSSSSSYRSLVQKSLVEKSSPAMKCQEWRAKD